MLHTSIITILFSFSSFLIEKKNRSDFSELAYVNRMKLRWLYTIVFLTGILGYIQEEQQKTVEFDDD
jgi:hypothetical protein